MNEFLNWPEDSWSWLSAVATCSCLVSLRYKTEGTIPHTATELGFTEKCHRVHIRRFQTIELDGNTRIDRRVQMARYRSEKEGVKE